MHFFKRFQKPEASGEDQIDHTDPDSLESLCH